MSWEQIKEAADNSSATYAHLEADYSLFTGYDMTDQDLMDRTGGGIRFGEWIPIPPQNQVDGRKETDISPSPVKLSRTRSSTPTSGDRVWYNHPNKTYLSNHPYSVDPLTDPPKDLNYAFADGSASRIKFDQLAPFMQYPDGSAFLWSDPN